MTASLDVDLFAVQYSVCGDMLVKIVLKTPWLRVCLAGAKSSHK